MEGELGVDVVGFQRDFGRQVRRWREARGFTQEELAHRAGVHVTYLSGIERGVRNPSLKNIRAIARALDLPVAELFAFETAAARLSKGC